MIISGKNMSTFLVSGNINYLWKFASVSRTTVFINRSGVLNSTNLQFSVAIIIIVFVSFRNKVDIMLPYDDTPLWISADANKDDLE